MNKFIYSQKVFTVLGFLLLPAMLISLSKLVNLFAPETLRFPEPIKIYNAIFSVLTEETCLEALTQTFIALSKAMTISLVLGIGIGLFLGLNRKIWSLSQPTIDFFRSIPVTFLIPAAALLIGSTSPKIIWVLATYPCLLIIIFSVRTGIIKQEPERVHSFYIICGSSNLIQRFFKVTIYEILPDIFSGFRIALSYCLVIVTVLEYMRLGNITGLGGLINDELQNMNYDRVYALTFVIGFLGFILNKTIEYLQQKLLHWNFD